MGVGIGGMLTQLLQGDPTAQLAQSLAGPNPNAPPPGGAQPAAGGPPGAAPPQQLAPAQAYAPDPANASTIAMLLKVHQQDMASNDINRNVQMISSGFGTAQQQHDKSALINSAGQGGGDTLGALGEIQKIQQGQMDLSNQQRFQASADLLGETVLGLKKGQGALLSSDPKLFELVAQHKLSSMDPTDLQKNIKAYTEQATAAGIPQDQINSAVQMAYTNSINPGQTREEKDMQRDMQRWSAAHPGQDPTAQPQFADLAANKGYNADIGAQAAAAGKEKIAAKSGLAGTLAQIKPIEDNINQMFGPDGKVRPEVIQAIQSADPPADGLAGSVAGALSRVGAGSIPGLGALSPSVMDQKGKLNLLQNQFNVTAMAGLKNIRTQREFTSAGGSISNMMRKGNSAAEIQSAAEELRDKFGLAKQNAIAAGGGEIDPAYADKVDKEYLNGGSLDNNATIAKGGQPLDDADLAQAKALIAQGVPRDKVVGHLRAKGFDIPSGL